MIIAFCSDSHVNEVLMYFTRYDCAQYQQK